MTYLEFLLSSPRFWTLLAGLFLGGAVSRIALVLLARDRRPEIQRRRVATLFVALAVAAGSFTTGIFVPEGYGVFEMQVLLFGAYVAAGALLLFSLFRYLLAPVALLLAVSVVGAIYLNAPWQSVRTETPIVRVRVLGAEGGVEDDGAEDGERDLQTGAGTEVFSLEVLAPEVEGDAWILDGTGAGFAPEIEIVRYHPAYFLLGRATAARLTGFVSYRRGQDDPGTWQEVERYPVAPDVAATSDRVVDPARRALTALPGITFDRVQPQPRAVRLLDHYRAVVAPGGDVDFERVE
ncbi:MAG: hypothetical protein ACLFO1_07205 [Spirochaetaceae bacterium]